MTDAITQAIIKLREALTPNPLCVSDAHALRLMREDAGAALDALEAALAEPALPASTYCRHCGKAAMAGGQTPICQDCWEELG